MSPFGPLRPIGEGAEAAMARLQELLAERFDREVRRAVEGTDPQHDQSNQRN